jgi:hypothetical protein
VEYGQETAGGYARLVIHLDARDEE